MKYSGVLLKSGVIGNTTDFGSVIQGSSPCSSTVFHCVLFLVDWGIAGRSMHLPVKQKMKVQFLLPQQCLLGVMVTHWSPKPAMGVQILQGVHHRDVA